MHQVFHLCCHLLLCVLPTNFLRATWRVKNKKCCLCTDALPLRLESQYRAFSVHTLPQQEKQQSRGHVQAQQQPDAQCRLFYTPGTRCPYQTASLCLQSYRHGCAAEPVLHALPSYGHGTEAVVGVPVPGSIPSEPERARSQDGEWSHHCYRRRHRGCRPGIPPGTTGLMLNGEGGRGSHRAAAHRAPCRSRRSSQSASSPTATSRCLHLPGAGLDRRPIDAVGWAGRSAAMSCVHLALD